jgi:hypothetical protein
MGASISTQNPEVSERNLLLPSRTSGLDLGCKHGFTTKFLCFGVRAPGEVKAFLLCIPI